MRYSISRATTFGWADVPEYNVPSEMLNKRIAIESLNQDGEVVSETILSNEDIKRVMTLMLAAYGTGYLLKEIYPYLFNDEEINIASDCLEVMKVTELAGA